MKNINLSEFPEDTCVYIKDKKRKELFKKLERKYIYLIRAQNKLNIKSSNFYDWRKGYLIRKNGKVIRLYIPLQKLKVICKNLKMNANSLQKDIKFIKVNSRAGTIKNPKLPLRVVPETFAVFGHLISDGYGGENGNACYVNTSDEAIKNFIKNLKIAFGNVEYHILKKHNRIIIPRLIPKILKKYFSIKDFRSSKSNLTKKILLAPRKYLLAFLKAIVIDEGSIRDIGIEINFTANKRLTNQVQKLCENRLKYICRKTYKNGFIISGENFNKIKEEIKDFIIPKKQKMFLKWFNRKSRTWYNKYKGTTKKKIIKALLSNSMSVSQLAFKLNINESGIRDQIKGYNLKGRYISGLLNMGIVKINSFGWRGTAIFDIKDEERALGFLKDGR